MSKKIDTNKKPYCKVCHDAGKSESEYNSHWVKDLIGNTTCPTLLNTECRYCFKFGHTTKFCDVLAKKNKEKERVERRTQAVGKEQPKQVRQNKQSNGFAALCYDSDSEEEKNTTITNKYSSLGTPSNDVNPVFNSVPVVEEKSWKDIVSKPKDTEPSWSVIYEPWTSYGEEPKVIKKRWADWSDWSDDSEYDAEAADDLDFDDWVNNW